MLRKMVSPAQRAKELELLKEYEASGKIRKIDYVPPEENVLTAEEEDKIEEELLNGNKDLGRYNLGDGNFRYGRKSKE